MGCGSSTNNISFPEIPSTSCKKATLNFEKLQGFSVHSEGTKPNSASSHSTKSDSERPEFFNQTPEPESRKTFGIAQILSQERLDNSIATLDRSPGSSPSSQMTADKTPTSKKDKDKEHSLEADSKSGYFPEGLTEDLKTRPFLIASSRTIEKGFSRLSSIEECTSLMESSVLHSSLPSGRNLRISSSGMYIHQGSWEI